MGGLGIRPNPRTTISRSRVSVPSGVALNLARVPVFLLNFLGLFRVFLGFLKSRATALNGPAALRLDRR